MCRNTCSWVYRLVLITEPPESLASRGMISMHTRMENLKKGRYWVSTWSQGHKLTVSNGAACHMDPRNLRTAATKCMVENLWERGESQH